MMQAIVVQDQAGAVIHIGPWDYQYVARQALDEDGAAVIDADGNAVMAQVATNPLPPGAVESAAPIDIYEGPDGGLYTADTLAASLRRERDRRLAVSDWTQLADVPDSTTKAAWATYRQALRDLPTQPGWPVTVTWPVAPG